MVLRAYVRDGQLVADEPVELPEGTKLELVAVDEFEDENLDEEERTQLLGAIDEGIAQVRAGDVIDASLVIRELRSRR